MKLYPSRLATLFIAATLTTGAAFAADSGLANTTVLVIRHGEKPETGTGLTPAGELRAKEYVKYFQGYKVDSKPVHVDYIFATKDSKSSARERLTVMPLSKALHLKIDDKYKNGQFAELVDAMKAKSHGKTVLICWHHGKIPAMLTAFGADANELIGAAKWPSEQFGWVIQLRFDGQGKLAEAKKIVEPF